MIGTLFLERVMEANRTKRETKEEVDGMSDNYDNFGGGEIREKFKEYSLRSKLA